jgi:hypothetical protein
MRPLCYALACALLTIEAAWAAAAGPLLPFKKTEPTPLPASIPWQELDDRSRDLILAVVEKATLAGRGPSETFTCVPEQYIWLLDHPDRAVSAWRRLGARCVSITPRGDGQFGWGDENGSDIVWETLHRSGSVRIWYAEGKVRPGPVMPLVPVKAVVVLTHPQNKTADGIQHRSEMFVQTDSKTAAAFTKMMGVSAQRVAEQGLGQLQLFFSALSWYLDRHPDQATSLLRAPAEEQGKR